MKSTFDRRPLERSLRDLFARIDKINAQNAAERETLEVTQLQTLALARDPESRLDVAVGTRIRFERRSEIYVVAETYPSGDACFFCALGDDDFNPSGVEGAPMDCRSFRCGARDRFDSTNVLLVKEKERRQGAAKLNENENGENNDETLRNTGAKTQNSRGSAGKAAIGGALKGGKKNG